jgi:geranylgeranyl transferase type-2 subunit alpha
MFTDPNDQSVWIYHRWLVGSGTGPYTILSGVTQLSLSFSRSQSLTDTLVVPIPLDVDAELLEREISLIQELLEEQPDSKCTSRHPCFFLCLLCLCLRFVWFFVPWIIIMRRSDYLFLFIGCLDSLVYYKRVLLRTLPSDSPDVDGLVRECVQLLDTLCRIDPGRKRRYEEIGKLAH